MTFDNDKLFVGMTQMFVFLSTIFAYDMIIWIRIYLFYCLIAVVEYNYVLVELMN